MKEQVVKMFTEVTMPEATEDRIRRAMDEKADIPKSAPWIRRMAAAAAMLALLLALSPQVRAAVREWVEVIAFQDGITIYKETAPDGSVSSLVGYATESPAWAEIREGRLYFLGNGQEIDITDEITEASPYFYTYGDKDGYKHFMVVGYSGKLENFGIYEFIQEADGSWFTGAGRNFLDPDTEQRYPWVEIVWEKLEIPWPMPGSDFVVDVEQNSGGEAERVEIGKK